jgi:hypothetical protein
MIHKGFNYLQKKYIWHNSELYCLPYESHKRYFGVRKCAFDGTHYCLGNGVRKSVTQVKSMTTEIESDFVFVKDKDCPF